MTLDRCAWLTDENVHPKVVQWLRSLGLDVVTVADLELAGRDDVDIRRAAHQQRRAILTHDCDFGMLSIAAGEPAFLIVMYDRGMRTQTSPARHFRP